MPNRYVCDALSEMRKFLKHHVVKNRVSKRDEAHLLCLVEEIQTYVNRMEASLGDKWDMHSMQESRSKLSIQHRELRKEVKDLTTLRDSFLEEYEDEEDEDDE